MVFVVVSQVQRCKQNGPSGGAGGWDEDEDDLMMDAMAFPSIRDFTVAKEREADVLDLVLAMVLQRQPPRQRLESEGEHYTEMAELHTEVRQKWLREHGDPPSAAV